MSSRYTVTPPPNVGSAYTLFEYDMPHRMWPITAHYPARRMTTSSMCRQVTNKSSDNAATHSLGLVSIAI